MPRHLLDSNFFIQAHREFYPLDVAVSFWQKVSLLADLGLIISIDKVRNELYRNEDPLTEWCQTNLPFDFFHVTDTLIPQYSQVANWANSRSSHYTNAALSEFLDADEADAWLVSKALTNPAEFVIVSHEKSNPERRKRVMIPEACTPFNISYVKSMDMFRTVGHTF